MFLNYKTAEEQVLRLTIPKEHVENITALIEYEKSVLDVTLDVNELVFAYPFEEDSGIYVMVANGQFCASNNRRALAGYMEKFDENPASKILIHKLGSEIDFDLSDKMRETVVV